MFNKADIIISELEKMFPNAKAELNYNNGFELLVAVVLSAQTTDIQVNKTTPDLFNKYPTPHDMANASYEDVEKYIKSIGLFRNKARFLVELSKMLVSKYNGVVPNKRSELEKLPGVGRKTANVVISNLYNIPAFAVDTHVERVSKRLGIAKKEDSVLEIERKLEDFFPKNKWLKLHHQMIFFGRYHCTARSPKCLSCPLFDVCVDEIKYQQI